MVEAAPLPYICSTCIRKSEKIQEEKALKKGSKEKENVLRKKDHLGRYIYAYTF